MALVKIFFCRVHVTGSRNHDIFNQFQESKGYWHYLIKKTIDFEKELCNLMFIERFFIVSGTHLSNFV